MPNLKCSILHIYFVLIFVTILKPNVSNAGRKYTKEDILKLREEVREMFNHAYNGYLKYAYPYDELRPLTCDGVDTWGSYSLTLIDALDTLAVMGNYSEFRRVVDIVTSKADFDANINVSVFETNIRIVGGLLSAHLFSQRAGVELEPGWPCNGPLLRLAEDVAKRLLAAFDTATGMPYGTVNLRHGVPHGETSVTCTAGVGTFILEFGALSRLTGDPVYEEVAMNALHALYHHRSSIGLYGNHIDVQTGRWTAQDSGIGAGVDSYLEYLVKGSMLVQRPELMAIFNEGRTAIDKHLRRNDWYLWVSMHKGQVTLPVFQSLEAYWPGVLSLIGDISEGMKSMHNYHQVWKQYGFTPEFYNIAQGLVGTNRESYPLRPELIESTMYLYRSTKDPFLLDIGMDILRSIQHSARTKCGYATIKDCRDHSLENRMESFFLAETTKYLYLLFDPDNFIHNNGQHGRVHTLPSGRQCILDAGGYIFNTEAHPIDPGALLCCSESYYEPKRYNKKTARGEKLSSIAKNDNGRPSSDIHTSNEKDRVEDSPYDVTEEDAASQTKEEFLGKLEKSEALDIMKVLPPSTDEIQSIEDRLGTQKMSLNMLQTIEALINISPEKHLINNSWSHDLLVEIIATIENAEQVVVIKDKINGDKVNEDSRKIKSVHSEEDANTVTTSGKNNENDHSITELNNASPLETVKDNNLLDDNRFRAKSTPNKNSLSPRKIVKGNETDHSFTNSTNVAFSQQVKSPDDYFSNQSEDEEKIKTTKELIEILLKQQFTTVKDSVLSEADFITFYLNKCNKNLELTKNLVELTKNPELRSKFLAKRLEVIMLAKELKVSLDNTKKLLNSKITEETVTLEWLKELTELVINGKTVKDYLEKYKSFIETARQLIDIGKESYITIESNIDMTTQEKLVSITGIDTSESEELNKSYNSEDDSKNMLESNSWKADDSSYQVDDRERVSPVSKMDAGPLFTDKLRLKTEAVIDLLPTSLVSSENPFNPQALLERIRNNPKYFRNSTWTTQYDLLTCMPQPYLNRIMLSGEFYND